jgi:hypothetical protein
MFTELYSRALSEWPAVLELPVRAESGSHLVEGLTALEQQISKPWVGHPDEVLMVNMHWAMATAYHEAFRKQRSVRREDLDASVVRRKFEADLRLIWDARIPSWTDDDRAIVARYFNSAVSK